MRKYTVKYLDLEKYNNNQCPYLRTVQVLARCMMDATAKAKIMILGSEMIDQVTAERPEKQVGI